MKLRTVAKVLIKPSIETTAGAGYVSHVGKRKEALTVLSDL